MREIATSRGGPLELVAPGRPCGKVAQPAEIATDSPVDFDEHCGEVARPEKEIDRKGQKLDRRKPHTFVINEKRTVVEMEVQHGLLNCRLRTSGLRGADEVAVSRRKRLEFVLIPAAHFHERDVDEGNVHVLCRQRAPSATGRVFATFFREKEYRFHAAVERRVDEHMKDMVALAAEEAHAGEHERAHRLAPSCD